MILELLDNNKLTASEISLYISDSFSVIKTDLKRLYLSRYLSRERKFDPVCGRYVFAYLTKNKNFPMPNILSTETQRKIVENTDFENRPKRNLPVQKAPHQKILIDPKNPNAKTYLNLGRAGSDYAWQKIKSSAFGTPSIGSTFSLYDGASV
jgi:hypothetical protein